VSIYRFPRSQFGVWDLGSNEGHKVHGEGPGGVGYGLPVEFDVSRGQEDLDAHHPHRLTHNARKQE